MQTSPGGFCSSVVDMLDKTLNLQYQVASGEPPPMFILLRSVPVRRFRHQDTQL